MADRLLWQWMCRTTDNADDVIGRIDERAARTCPLLLDESDIAHDGSASFGLSQCSLPSAGVHLTS